MSVLLLNSPLDRVETPETPEARRARLSQYDTPRWVAQTIVEHCGLARWSSGLVIEPACGTGSFLHAVPAHLQAIGVEIDEERAAEAARATGRTVVVGDFRQVTLPERAQCLIGNPPFDAQLVAQFMQRAHTLLEPEGFVCFILPAYLFQTSSKVLAYREKWSLYQQLMPRNLFPNLKLPLVLARFVKDGRRLLHGFFLYEETADTNAMPAAVKATLQASAKPGSVWRHAVHEALCGLGGSATTAQIYRAIEPKRPTGNPWWKEQIRKVLQTHAGFVRAGDAWTLASDAQVAVA